MKIQRLVLAILFTAASLGLSGCGDDSSPSNQTLLYDEGLAKLTEAGENAADLRDVLDWIDAHVADADEGTANQLHSLRGIVQKNVGDAFAAVARNTARRGEVDACRRLVTWAEELIEKERARPDAETNPLPARLEKSTRDLYLALLTEKPDDGELRRRAGYVPVDIDWKARAKEPWLSADDRNRLAELEKFIKNEADETPGGTRWVSHRWAHLDELDEFLDHVEELKSAYRKRLEDPFEKAAKRLFDKTVDDLGREMNTAYQWESRTHKPYVILVEKDKSWNETRVAEAKAKALRELYDTFYGEYQDVLDLEHIERPVPVIIFKRREAYRYYAAKRGADTSTAAHYEPWTGRLVLPERTGIGTLFHEGTHQLVHYNTSKNGVGVRYTDQSYWFSEGVAEFISGNHRYLDPETKEWRFEIGLLQGGRLSYWRQNEHKAYDLWDLMNLTYRARHENKAKGEEDLNLFAYSQGWFLIYFLNNFAADKENVVRIGEPGKYRDAWLQYFRRELKGETGRDVLLDCLGLKKKGGELDNEAFASFRKEYDGYYEWLNRKLAMKYHTKDNRMIPWDKVENKGRMIGEKMDDALYPDELAGN